MKGLVTEEMIDGFLKFLKEKEPQKELPSREAAREVLIEVLTDSIIKETKFHGI